MNPKQRLTKPLTSRDREQYVHKLRTREGRIAWTVNKSRFGQFHKDQVYEAADCMESHMFDLPTHVVESAVMEVEV